LCAYFFPLLTVLRPIHSYWLWSDSLGLGMVRCSKKPLGSITTHSAFSAVTTRVTSGDISVVGRIAPRSKSVAHPERSPRGLSLVVRGRIDRRLVTRPKRVLRFQTGLRDFNPRTLVACWRSGHPLTALSLFSTVSRSKVKQGWCNVPVFGHPNNKVHFSLLVDEMVSFLRD
jgi:hypothetical protein